jgi:protein SCO1
MKTIALLSVLAIACSSRAPEPTAPPAQHEAEPESQAAPVEPPAAAAPIGESIYDLPIALEDANARPIGLDVGRGHPTLVSMFYGSCATACPAIIGYMKNIAASSGDDVRILLVTFDPERDTPARLSELTTKFGLDTRWTLARPSATDARSLAAILGVKFRAIAGGELAHNAVIVALDRDGRPLARIEGLGDNERLVAALR